jgi:hypothetical protein
MMMPQPMATAFQQPPDFAGGGGGVPGGIV